MKPIHSTGTPSRLHTVWAPVISGVLLMAGSQIPSQAAVDPPLPSFAAARVFTALENANSVLTADFNGDGLSDLAVGHVTTNALSIFLSTGSGQLAPPISVMTAPLPSGMTAGDFNNDHILDLIVSHRAFVEGASHRLLLGRGDGTFEPGTPVVGVSGVPTAADLDQDGNLDFVAGLTWWRGRGNGAFAAFPLVSNTPFFPDALDVAIGDLNNDQRLDVVLASGAGDAGGRVTVILNAGGGTFAPAAPYESGQEATSVDLADFNHDARPDIVAGNRSSNDVSVYLNLGDGTFAAATMYPAHGVRPAKVGTGDFNRDGHPDFVVINSETKNLAVYPGNGRGGFELPVLQAGSSTSGHLDLGDVDGDGWTDLVLPDSNLAFGAHAWVLLNQRDGSFQSAPKYPTDRGGKNPVAADLNGDGRPELIIPNGFTNTIRVLLNDGAGRFLVSSNYTVGNRPQTVAVADVNSDGTNDVMVASPVTGHIALLIGNGDGTLRQATNSVALLGGTSSILAGDYTGDGRPDLLIAELFGATVHPGNGDGTFGNGISTTGPFPFQFLRAGHFNGDSQPDIAYLRNATNVAVMLGIAGGTFQEPRNYSVTVNATSLTVGDFNGDGRDDLAVSSLDCTTCGEATPRGDLSVLINQGDGTFAAAVRYPAPHRPTAVTNADFNGDGHRDLAVTDLLWWRVSILPGRGDGTFAEAASFGAGHGPDTPAAADLNGDGRPDLIVANGTENSLSILLNTFTPPAAFEPTLQAPRLTDGQIELRYVLEPGHAYELRAADALRGAPAVLTNYTVKFTGFEAHFSDPLTAEQRFYQLVITADID